MGDNKNLLGGIFYLLTPDRYGEYSNEQQFSNIKTLPYDKINGGERITVQEEVEADYSPFELVKEADEKLRKPLDTENTNILYEQDEQVSDYKKFKQMIEALANYCNEHELEILKEQWFSKGGNEKDFELFKKYYAYSYNVKHDLKIKFNLNGRSIEIGRLLQELFYNPYLFKTSVDEPEKIIYLSQLDFMNLITSTKYIENLKKINGDFLKRIYNIELNYQNGKNILDFIFYFKKGTTWEQVEDYYNQNRKFLEPLIRSKVKEIVSLNDKGLLSKFTATINIFHKAKLKYDSSEKIENSFQLYLTDVIREMDEQLVNQLGYKKTSTQTQITYFEKTIKEQAFPGTDSKGKNFLCFRYEFTTGKPWTLKESQFKIKTLKRNWLLEQSDLSIKVFESLLKISSPTEFSKKNNVDYTIWWNENKVKIDNIIKREPGGWAGFLKKSYKEIFGYFLEDIFPILGEAGTNNKMLYSAIGGGKIHPKVTEWWKSTRNPNASYSTQPPADDIISGMGGFQLKGRNMDEQSKYTSIRVYDPTEFSQYYKETSGYVSLFDVANSGKYSIVQFIGEDRYPYFVWLTRNAAFLNKKMKQTITADDIKTYLSFCLPTFFRFSISSDFKNFAAENIEKQVFFFLINFSVIPISFILKNFEESISETFYKELFNVMVGHRAGHGSKRHFEPIKQKNGEIDRKRSYNINNTTILRLNNNYLTPYVDTKSEQFKNKFNDNVLTSFYRFKGYEIPIDKIIGLDYIFADLGKGW